MRDGVHIYPTYRRLMLCLGLAIPSSSRSAHTLRGSPVLDVHRLCAVESTPPPSKPSTCSCILSCGTRALSSPKCSMIQVPRTLRAQCPSLCPTCFCTINLLILGSSVSLLLQAQSQHGLRCSAQARAASQAAAYSPAYRATACRPTEEKKGCFPLPGARAPLERAPEPQDSSG